MALNHTAQTHNANIELSRIYVGQSEFFKSVFTHESSRFDTFYTSREFWFGFTLQLCELYVTYICPELHLDSDWLTFK